MHGKNKSEVQEKVMKELPWALSTQSVSSLSAICLLLTGESAFQNMSTGVSLLEEAPRCALLPRLDLTAACLNVSRVLCTMCRSPSNSSSETNFSGGPLRGPPAWPPPRSVLTFSSRQSPGTLDFLVFRFTALHRSCFFFFQIVTIIFKIS